MIKALIYGGRDWDNQPLMNAVLNYVHREYVFTSIINGGQVSRRVDDREHLYGADWQASVWASGNKILVDWYYANWTLGKRAGPMRNERMLYIGKPTLGVEFPGGKGTAHMRGLLDRAGVSVIEAKGLLALVQR
jgi:hypothetical protein